MSKHFPFLRAETIQSKAWFLWMTLIALLYYPTFRIFPYWDDPDYVIWAASYGGSMMQHGDSQLFRPIERYIINLSLHGPLPTYWLTKILALVLLFLSTLLVAKLAKLALQNEHKWLQFAIPTLYLLHPMHVITVLEMDITSQNLGTFFSLALVLVVCRLAVLDAGSLNKAAVFRATAALFVVSLLGAFSKETFLGMIAAAPFLMAIAAWRPGAASRMRLAFLASGAISALTLGIYFTARRLAGFVLLSGPVQPRYRVHFGLNVLVNAGVAVGASLFPGSTLKLFVHLNVFYVALAFSLVLAGLLLFWKRYRDFALAMASGRIFQSSQQRLLAIFLLAGAATILPGGMINGLISENQTDATISFVLLVVLLVPALIPERDERPTSAAVLGASAVLIGMIAVMMGTAASEKVLAAQEMSRHANAMGEEIVKHYEAHPVGHFFLCIPPESLQGRYSVFHISDGMLAAEQLYRIQMLHPAKPANFIPGYSADLCSMQLLDERLSPATPTGAEAR
ncbi:MAG: hypothetical protein ACYCSN_07065 [Acidobacteriaceae bacterium]